MAKPISESGKPQKLPRDANQRMHSIASQLTPVDEAPKPLDVTQDDISRVMSALGRRGGRKGGKRRLETMTQEQRSDIAFKAARARWDKTPKA
jgi:hypothetical protein